MASPVSPYRPYLAVHEALLNGGKDERPTALQVVADCNALGSLRGQSVLITGCSGGIGKTTAAALYETGAALYLTARDLSKMEDVIEEIVQKSPSKEKGFPRPVPIELHLDSLESVRSAATTIKSKTDSLHLLINNAGVGGVPHGTTKDGFETHMGVNHFAHFLLFQLLRPLLLKAHQTTHRPSRIINVSSTAHFLSQISFSDLNWQTRSYQKFPAYGQSKLANIFMTTELTRRYSSQGLLGLAVHPGGIFEGSQLTRYMTEEDSAGFTKESMERIQKVNKTPEQGAATTVWAAVSGRFEDVANGGRYLGDVGESPLASDDEVFEYTAAYAGHAFDEEGERRLWEVSCEAVGVDGDL
ncbi:hypothetical protein M409DRAFT_63901 [Zasmidium cellare ATCC 36951]|uniref:Short-chain dehydrogenase n=1 Tax=Zasmidium cellare ATCC 36951 TaxID=1080233 RepID=A0A6A6CUM7_ZASCE|nr:uncharacterized protein M409DRAFT_63901 [Zasmidium cellare ATCC 36951]KAF2170864.1 hypothetical protein M409DRAFT_63901 [Zasmidium cellare ATCC 36951]